MAFPVDIAQVRKTETALDLVFPSSFVERMMRNNGGDLVIDGEEWSLHPFLDTSDRTRLTRTCNDIIRETKSAKAWDAFPRTGVAIGSNGMGDLLVLLPDPVNAKRLQPAVFMWSHETGELDVVVHDFRELDRDQGR